MIQAVTASTAIAQGRTPHGAEHEPGGDHDDALGPGADPDVALQAERLGAGAGVGDEERAGDGCDGDDDEDVLGCSRAKT